uniref:O-methyltransferase, family 3 n=1 Tax=Solibacter usitatus (strain Ellin6076) TaxID=234267 RepID=Q022N0_SOLUE
MEPLNEQLIERIDAYIEALFTPPDAVLSENLADAEAAGLPAINVSPNQGRLLYLLAKIAGARRVLEVGTLGGYSTTWLARALPANGLLVTLELDPKHAEVARRSLDRAGLAPRIEVRVGPAAGSLRDLIRSATAPFDLVFLDANKSGYVEYLDLALQLSRPGTLILADNVIRHGLVLDSNPADPNDAGARAYNEAIAGNPRLESLVLPIVRARVDGLAISIVR